MIQAASAAGGQAMKTEQDCIQVEIAPEALRRLMADGRLAATDFRCRQRNDRMRVRRWCLELLRERLQQ